LIALLLWACAGAPEPTPEVRPLPAPSGAVVRFAALGDGGVPGSTVNAVGLQLAKTCAARGCDFALYLGDNVYPHGVTSPEDPRLKELFEDPFAPVDLPFFVVLGNHDVGGDLTNAGYAEEKARAQIDYSLHSGKWAMPDRYYEIPPTDKTRALVRFVGLDTTALFYGHATAPAQRAWLKESLDRADSRWRVAFGHHPYVSNGQHGNAGAYEGLSPYWPGAALVRGDAMKTFFESDLSGRVDLYLAGHDHNRQWLGERCGTHHAVSGAAAKLTPRGEAPNTAIFEDYERAGFLWVEVRDHRLEAWFLDVNGREDGPFVIEKP
jgi:tartrate-resistant acid phosphatase type 5